MFLLRKALILIDMKSIEKCIKFLSEIHVPWRSIPFYVKNKKYHQFGRSPNIYFNILFKILLFFDFFAQCMCVCVPQFVTQSFHSEDEEVDVEGVFAGCLRAKINAGFFICQRQVCIQ